MSSPFSFFGAGRDRGGAPSLGEALSLLLEPPAEGETRPAKRPRRGRERPSLERAEEAAWFESLGAAAGELVSLRLSGGIPVLLLAAAAEGAGGGAGAGAGAEDRPGLAGFASFLAGLAAGEGRAEGLVLAERASASSLLEARRWTGGGRKYLARGGRLLVHLAEPFAEAIEARLASEPDTLDGFAEAAFPGLAPPSRIALEGGQDFPLSQFLLPPSFPAGPAAAGSPPPEASVFWDELSLGGDPDPSALWFAAQYGDPGLGFVLAFECPSNRPDRADYGARLLPVLRQAWSGSARRLAKLVPAVSSPRFGALDSPPSGLLRGAARVSGEVRIGAGGFPFAAHLPPRFAAALEAALAAAGADRPECLGGQGALAGLVALNESLLRLWGAGYREAFLRPRSPPGFERKAAAPPLAPLLACLGARDAALAVQNCLLPRYGAKGLPYLFYYHAPFERNGRRALRPVPLAPMRDADILRLLPASAREEWEQERRRGLPQRSLSASSCAASNDEAARLVWEAARSGRIGLSPGSLDLLGKLVGGPLEAASRARLEALAEQDIPFGLLAALDRRDAARIVDRLPNRELALASVGDGRHLDLLRAPMGSGRRRDFGEELELAAKRMERGELSVDQVAEAKLGLLERMRGIAEDLRRERAALPGNDGPRLRASGPRA